MSEDKPKNSFWIVFILILLLVVTGGIINIKEYRKQARLNAEGKRLMLAVDSVVRKGRRTEVFVNLNVDGVNYTVTTKMKGLISEGDSVPVYYLPDEPSVNGIAAAD